MTVYLGHARADPDLYYEMQHNHLRRGLRDGLAECP